MTCIVATNNRQLSYTIKKYYGTEFDGYGYLNKIYDTVITLGTDKLEEYTKNYCGIMQYNNLPEKMSFVLFKFLNFYIESVINTCQFIILLSHIPIIGAY